MNQKYLKPASVIPMHIMNTTIKAPKFTIQSHASSFDTKNRVRKNQYTVMDQTFNPNEYFSKNAPKTTQKTTQKHKCSHTKKSHQQKTKYLAALLLGASKHLVDECGHTWGVCTIIESILLALSPLYHHRTGSLFYFLYLGTSFKYSYRRFSGLSVISSPMAKVTICRRSSFKLQSVYTCAPGLE